LNCLVSGLELWQWRNRAIQAAIATDVPVLEVDWLLQEVANLDRLTLRLESFKARTQILMGVSLGDLENLWQRRLDDRLPIQYIAGVAPWRLFKITVSNAVLIPRPETEDLIDLAVVAAAKSLMQQGDWADLGTGSGVIACGLAAALPHVRIHAVDLSPAALAIAQINAKNLGFADRIQFYQGSWWEPLLFPPSHFSGMVSNPPYIPSSVLPSLQPEVFKHEPHLALDGGADGLDCIRSLIEVSPAYLRSGGVWLIEMMAGQAEAVVAMLEDNGNYRQIEVHADLAGINRFILAYRS
jgi:release factor glutamine methyltransferase